MILPWAYPKKEKMKWRANMIQIGEKLQDFREIILITMCVHKYIFIVEIR